MAFYWNVYLPELTSRLRNCFLCFMRRFWNHVFTCVSLRPRATANSTRSGVDRYLLRSIYGKKNRKIGFSCHLFTREQKNDMTEKGILFFSLQNSLWRVKESERESRKYKITSVLRSVSPVRWAVDRWRRCALSSVGSDATHSHSFLSRWQCLPSMHCQGRNWLR